MTDELKVARELVDGMSDPAVLLDSELHYVTSSQTYSILTGLRPRALKRRLQTLTSPLELLSREPDADIALARSCMESGKALQLAEVSVVNAAGDELTVNVTFLPVMDAGRGAAGLIQSFRDVSAEARMQKRYRELLDRERLRAESLEREVEARTRELSAALEEVTRLSRVDPLTGLLNRRAFTELATQSLSLAKRHGRHVGILIGDLDHFKRVNDTYGHQVGDRLLVATATTMRESVRESDPVARFGGEEFVVLLTETEPEAVTRIADRIRASIFDLDCETTGIEAGAPTISVGMALYPGDGETLDDLIKHADEALYCAKEGGRNRVVAYADIADQGLPAVSTLSRRRVLLSGSRRADQYEAALGDSYRLLVARDEAEASALCQRDQFDAVIADHADCEHGVEFLRKTLRFRPDALRILVLDTAEMFAEVRGVNLARVDGFLLRSQGPSHITSVIDEGLASREMDRQHLFMQTDSVRRLISSRIAEMEELIRTRDLYFHFQPIVEPTTRKIHAFEALCRTDHAVFGRASILFEAAVQIGCLWELGRVTRELAAARARELPDGAKLFINLHPGEIDDPELENCATADVADRIVFEITERAAIPDLGRFRDRLSSLGDRGYQFAIDDLGAGYASLNAVALTEPDYIKIDMMLVRGIDRSPRRAQLMRRMVEFANDIGIRIIAEGVETAAEAEIVTEVGCHLVQGYYYGRPAPLEGDGAR